MSLFNLFKLSYYFDSSLGYTFSGFWMVLILLVMLFVASLVINFKLSKFKNISGIKKKFLVNCSNLILTVSLVGLIYLFFRYQGIPCLNWRFWPILLVLIGLIWAGYLIYFKVKVMPVKLLIKQQKKSGAYYFRKRKKK